MMKNKLNFLKLAIFGGLMFFATSIYCQEGGLNRTEIERLVHEIIQNHDYSIQSYSGFLAKQIGGRDTLKPGRNNPIELILTSYNNQDLIGKLGVMCKLKCEGSLETYTKAIINIATVICKRSNGDSMFVDMTDGGHIGSVRNYKGEKEIDVIFFNNTEGPKVAERFINAFGRSTPWRKFKDKYHITVSLSEYIKSIDQDQILNFIEETGFPKRLERKLLKYSVDDYQYSILKAVYPLRISFKNLESKYIVNFLEE
jgi:hypothetical protein